jgi:MoaA/NifB/PqqE/SkfB family radical SAM enzyme
VIDDLSKWQPPYLVKVLLELEGESDQEYTVAIKRTGSIGPMQIMGEHRSFAIKWLGKHYHKIGGYLHAPRDIDPARRPQQIEPQEVRPYLETVIAEWERVVESSLTLTLAPTVEFNCKLCGRKTVAYEESAKRRGRVSCLRPGCEADYVVSTAEDGSLYFRPDGWVFPCQACKYRILVPSKHLVPDHEFACDSCGRRHKLVKDWYYAVEVENGAEV